MIKSIKQLPPSFMASFQLVTLYSVYFLVIFQLNDQLRQIQAFHLSFGHRLFKQQSIQQQTNPQLNPASTLIRPIECRNANNHSEAGICMFSIDCMQNKGVPLSICKHNYFVGTCCRLPDYNNFVGIVYDLRDTETANQLEARKSALIGLSSSSSPSSATTTTTTTTTTAAPPVETDAPSTTIQQQQEPLSTSAAATTAQQRESSTIPPHFAASPSDQSSSERPLEEKYIISSASLFSSSEAAATTTTSKPEQQQTTTTTAAAASTLNSGLSEQQSARNADGSNASINNSNIKPPTAPEFWPPPGHEQTNSLLDSSSSAKVAAPTNDLVDTFQIQLGPTAAPATTTTTNHVKSSNNNDQATPTAIEFSNKQAAINSSAYEMIKDDQQSSINSNSQQEQQLAAGEVLSSAHSAPATSTTGNQQQTSATNNHMSAQQLETRDDVKQQQEAATTTTIVLSNQHRPITPSNQPATTTANNSTASDLIDIANKITSQFMIATTSSGDQEFALSSLSPSVPVVAKNETDQPQQPQPNSASDSAPKQAASVQSEPEQQTLISHPTSMSPFVDLISPSSDYSASSSPPPSQAQQTTTPDFTSSLSTVSLPIVNSHPYSPTTTSAPQTTTESQQQQQQQQQGSNNSQMLVSNSTTKTNQDQQQQQQSYSTSQNQPPPPSNSFILNSLLNNNQRPSLLLSNANLQATSKIVAAPTSNHLIPGLGGLQSAILSHIPFKIASGLSSGLSSYLQAAMNKPSSMVANSQLGSHQNSNSNTNNKPLLSSNTATASQYHQNQQQQQNQTKPNAGATAIKFPSLTTTSSLNNSSSQLNLDNQLSFASSQQQQTVKLATSSSSETRDIIKEAQLVCGRPQVSNSASQFGGDQSNSIQSSSAVAAKRRIGRIVGGNQSWFGQWPWMVSLRQWRKGAFLHKCGAALLNENWAITAAHCVENVKPSDLLLRLGEFDVSKQDEPFPFIERRVKTIVSHPSFDPKTFEYDLALLRFAEPIVYERNIIPVCVPQGNDSYVDRMATVIGWGRLYEDGPLPDVIQHVDVPIITNNECERMYKNAGYIEEIPEMFICAGINKGGRDSCEGDSGGPLTMVDHDGRSYLVGIISWGIGCALPSQPGVYTRITAFSGWINSLIIN